ncbi:hypothetical protein [Sulfurospirillum oryzae]|uniref:hypothetical protein n=1 Tax=Sulfurospirillum oryzae TaxID=2976535 RepID=UPI0021E80DB7|nr:hypothetical protein [Sulfurospirillum oryzae]
MRFLTMLAAFFAIFYLVIVVHAFSYPRQQQAEDIEALSLHVKDTKLSLSFPTNEYQRFVYAQ